MSLSAADGTRLFEAAGMLGEFELAFETVDGEVVVQTQSMEFDGGDAIATSFAQADDEGVFKMAVLIDEIHALQAGAAFCEGSINPMDAADQIEAVVARLQEASDELGDAPLTDEAILINKLLENLAGGQQNCW